MTSNGTNPALPARRRWRHALPLFLMIIGVWLLVGCIYLPIPEHPADSLQMDFRRPLRDKPLAIGATRAQILALLGPPDYISQDHQAVVYTYDTQSGLSIYFLCALAWPTGLRQVALGLVFDSNDRLVDWDVAEQSNNNGFILPMPASPKAAFDLKPSVRERLYPTLRQSPQTQASP